MALKRIPNFLRYGILTCLAVFGLAAAEHHGQVKFSGLPVPGATVTVTQGDKKAVAVTDQQGAYAFTDLAEGIWTIQVEMLCFTTIKQEIGVAPNAPSPEWELKLMPFDEIKASAPPPAAPTPSTAPAATATAPTGDAASQAAAAQPTAPAPSIAQAAQQVGGKKPAATKKGKAGSPPPPTTTAQSGFQRTGVNASPDAAKPAADAAPAAPTTTDAQAAGDGFLINGSQNNGASSPFAQSPAFGNNRRGFRSPYQASVAFILDNSALDASPFSVNGQFIPKPSTNRFQGVANFGGPLTLKHIIPASRYPINFFINYQWTRNRNGSTTPGLMPTAAERAGDFSQLVNPQGQLIPVFDPTTGLPFPNNVVPQNRISPQAKALLSLFPLPNFTSSSSYNYQIPIVNSQTTDDIRTTMSKTLSAKNQVNGTFAYQRSSSVNPNGNGYAFVDTGGSSGINSLINWQHRFSQRMFGTLGLQFSRATNHLTPFFANRENISGEAGITGNNQDPQNWGPPSLGFSSGISALYDGVLTNNRNQTTGTSVNAYWNRRSHNINFGGDYRRQQFDYLSQSNPRGSFSFNGLSTQQVVNGQPVSGTGSDFAGFLLGIPDQSSIAYGNADKYLRSQTYDGFITDDWRVRAGFTLNLGLRWDYSSPITELYGRLVNLDIAPGYGPVAPVVANNPVGSLTGLHYPDSLVHPDKHEFQPRVAIAWHPFLASSLTIRAGYGVYYDTSIYQSIAQQMYQQSPLSKSLNVQNDPINNPLTLASGFNAAPNITTNNFAVDPNFRVGYSQNWQVTVYRDLPAALIVTGTYLGIKGTRGQEQFYPNTYPIGELNPCPICLPGYKYLTSNGNSTREAGTIQLRRRLHNGFTSTLQYTLSKAIDDSGLGGGGRTGGTSVIAQNWLNLSGERGLSSFDPHHSASFQVQYSTGVGLRGGALLSGWRGLLIKEWTFVDQVTLSSGLPLTPVYPLGIPGTAFTGIRPNYTGASVYNAPPGLFLNVGAFAPPAPGQWGNAGRDSIIGPSQFSMIASMGRSFTVGDRHSIDVRFDATNILNHVTFPSWNTNILSPQFGLPGSANAMRAIRANVRLRF
jgi:hypothetical protein